MRTNDTKPVTLLPNDKRLKQLIAEFGREWHETDRGKVACFNGDEGVAIESECGRHSRWVRSGDVKPDPVRRSPSMGGW